MKKNQSKFRLAETQGLDSALARASQTRAQATVTAEELIGVDATTITVPPSIEHRLKLSVAGDPPVRASWWRRLFSGGSSGG